MLFDLAFVSLVALAAVAGIRRIAVFAGIALAIVIPLFGVVQPRILPGPEHWIVRTAHLLLGVIAMVMAARLARFVDSARTSTAHERKLRPTRLLRDSEPRPAEGSLSQSDALSRHKDVATIGDGIAART
jgi:hypothetical protein